MSLRSTVYAVYERRLRKHLEGLPVPRHVAIMIDGNRRWARAAGFDDVAQGHLVGARHIANLLAMEIAGIADTALYAGSWSQWGADRSRPVEQC